MSSSPLLRHACMLIPVESRQLAGSLRRFWLLSCGPPGSAAANVAPPKRPANLSISVAEVRQGRPAGTASGHSKSKRWDLSLSCLTWLEVRPRFERCRSKKTPTLCNAVKAMALPENGGASHRIRVHMPTGGSSSMDVQKGFKEYS